MEMNKRKQRRAFVRDYESGQWSMTELCQPYGVSRPTGYLWLDRYQENGEADLVERSRAPTVCPHRTPREIERRILALRERYG
jgi:transposase